MPAARCARTAQAAVRTKANGIDNGARYEGSGNDEAEASAALRAYASAASDSDEAAAVAARRTSLAAVDNGEVARARCHHPTTATTVADAANVNDNEVTNGGHRRPKTVTAAAGVNDDEVDGRRTTPALTTTMLQAASTATTRLRAAGAAVLLRSRPLPTRPALRTLRPRMAGATADVNDNKATTAAAAGPQRQPHERKTTPGPTRTPMWKPTGGHSSWVPADKLASPRDPAKKRPLGSRVTAGEPPME